MRRTALVLLSGLLFSTGCSQGPQLHVSPLQLPAAGTALVAPSGRSVAITVKDGRGAEPLLASGFLGPGGEKGQGIYFGYVAAKPEEVPAYFESAAAAALPVLGLTGGGSTTLEITIEAFRIDLYRFSGFSPMNAVGYGRLKTRLASEGRDIGGGVFNVTFFESTTPAMSMKEVTREAVSRIYTQAAWEAIVGTLAPAFSLKADPAKLDALIARMAAEKNEYANRRSAFWLGLLGQEHAGVAAHLKGVILASKDPRYRQGAAEAAGMLKLADLKPDLEKILTTKVGDWNNADTEQVWYVLKALHQLGEKDLAARIPKTDLKYRSKLDHLVAFLATGEPPALTAEEKKGLEAAKANVKR